jgi:hypothetical protein
MCFEMKNTLKTQSQSHSQTRSSLSKSLICVLKGEITGFFLLDQYTSIFSMKTYFSF